MAAEALIDGKEHGHLVGDAPALLVVAIVLAALAPRAGAAGTLRETRMDAGGVSAHKLVDL
jgi:hypothetical protein